MRVIEVSVLTLVLLMIVTLACLLGHRNSRIDDCRSKGGVFLRAEEVCVRMEVL